MNGADVIAAATECAAFLAPMSDREWDVPIPEMELTVAGVVAHIAEGCLWYATDLAAGPRELSTMADPSGFAAMACDELLVHTDDAGRGLGRPFVPTRPGG